MECERTSGSYHGDSRQEASKDNGRIARKITVKSSAENRERIKRKREKNNIN